MWRQPGSGCCVHCLTLAQICLLRVRTTWSRLLCSLPYLGTDVLAPCENGLEQVVVFIALPWHRSACSMWGQPGAGCCVHCLTLAQICLLRVRTTWSRLLGSLPYLGTDLLAPCKNNLEQVVVFIALPWHRSACSVWEQPEAGCCVHCLTLAQICLLRVRTTWSRLLCSLPYLGTDLLAPCENGLKQVVVFIAALQ